MKKMRQTLALLLAGALTVGSFAGCGGSKAGGETAGTETAGTEAAGTAASGSDTPLVIANDGMSEKFSPFFAESVPDQNIVDVTQISLVYNDRSGEFIYNGIEGETTSYNGTDYTYYGPTDLTITENEDGTIKGYVCLKFSIYWGLACTFIMDIIHPIIYAAIRFIPFVLGVVLLSIIMCVFAADCIITVTTILKFNKRLKVMDEMAASIHRLSDEIGENIYENVTDVIEKSEKFQETHVELMDKISKSKHVGILGTTGTITSDSYSLEIKKMFPHMTVTGEACPMWVPLVENNEFDSPGADYFVRKHLEHILAADPEIDTLVLGCTHYPLLIEKIKAFLPEGITLFSQGEYVAASLTDYLRRHPEMDIRLTKQGNCRFLTTESAAKFSDAASVFLNHPVEVEQIRLVE